MNTIKYLILPTLFLSIGFNRSFAQALYPISIDEKVAQANLIAEGTVTGKHSFWNPAHTMIYTNNKVKLHKIFKGIVQTGSIEVLTVGGSVENESVEASDFADLSIGETGLFFCYPNSINLKAPITHAVLWDIYSSAQGFIRYDLSKQIADAPFASYSNIVDKLYPAITQRTNRAFTNIDPQFHITAFVAPQQHNNLLAITSFSPTRVAAGATENGALNLLTITGTDFGTGSGTDAILFDDANNGTGGTPFAVPFNDPLIVSWTNTQIQVKVPSRAGTGTFDVRAGGSTITSAGTLTVIYSILTSSFSGIYTAQSNLMNSNGTGGYTILYSNNTAGSGANLDASPTKITFQRALNTWKDIVGFNITEGGATSIQQVNPSDGNNVIMFDNTNTGNAPLAVGILGTCYTFTSTCSPLGSFAVRRTEFDIVIRSGASAGSNTFELGPCYPASADLDMETVLLHELGHAISLGHINDNYQYTSGPITSANPAKLMHFAVTNGVARKSPDWSAFIGAKYSIATKNLSYGNCPPGGFTEMTPLAVTIDAKDDCPGSFPSTATPKNTLVTFDLAHATSNKNVDPQWTAIRCDGVGTGVTTNAYYAIRTGLAGEMTVSVNGYTSSPTDLASCSNAGVQLTLYQVSNCPTGQAYPAPISSGCRTFKTDGALPDFTNLTAATNYLLVANGENSTKATFQLLLNGSALPLRNIDFNGSVKNIYNDLYWKMVIDNNIRSVVLESSKDAIHYIQVREQAATGDGHVDGTYLDNDIATKKYYRLKIIYYDGSVEYSKILLLQREMKANTMLLSPNPAGNYVNIAMNREKAAILHISLMDASGKKVLQQTRLSVAGIQNIQLTGLEALPSGSYIVLISDGERTSSNKLFKR